MNVIEVMFKFFRENKEQLDVNVFLKPTSRGRTPLFVAAQNGHSEGVKRFLEFQYKNKSQLAINDVLLPCLDGTTPIEKAKLKERHSVVREIVTFFNVNLVQIRNSSIFHSCFTVILNHGNKLYS